MIDPFNLTDLEELEALHAAATPGKWKTEVWQGNDDTNGWAAVGPHQYTEDCVCETEEDREACEGMDCCEDERSYRDEEQAQEDAKAIAALHNAFPALAKALREAWERDERVMSDERMSEQQILDTIRAAQEQKDKAIRQRDEARAEVAKSNLGGMLAAQQEATNDDLRALLLESALALEGLLRVTTDPVAEETLAKLKKVTHA